LKDLTSLTYIYTSAPINDQMLNGFRASTIRATLYIWSC